MADFGRLCRARDLDERFAFPQKRESSRQSVSQDFAHAGVRCVAAGYPDYLWGRASALQQLDKVAILRHHGGSCISCRIEYRVIGRIKEAEMSNGRCLDGKLFVEPGANLGESWASIQSFMRQ